MFMYESFASGQKIITNLYNSSFGKVLHDEIFLSFPSQHCRTRGNYNEIKDALENLSSFSLLLFSRVMYTFLTIQDVIMFLISKNQPPWCLFPSTAIEILLY